MATALRDPAAQDVSEGARISGGCGSFNMFMMNIPVFCKYISARQFNKAMLLMSPDHSMQLNLTLADNARSPFVVIAIAETAFYEMIYLDKDRSEISIDIGHLYAQALVDLEILRQFFVDQIRNNSTSQRRKNSSGMV